MRVPAQFAFIAGAAIGAGIVDAVCIAKGIHGAAGAFNTAPPRLWVAVPLVWIAVAALLAIVIAPLARRYTAAVVTIALELLFVVLRGGDIVHGWRLALAMLALGAATVLAARRWLVAPRLGAARAALIAIVLFAAACGASTVHGASPEHRPQTTAPDVIVMVLDTVRADALDASLPNIARLRAEGVSFDRVYSAASWTLPSHLAAFTGADPAELGIDFDHQHYRGSVPTLAQRLHARGYRTAAVVSNTFLYRGSGFERGFDRYAQAEAGLDVCRSAPGMWLDAHWPRFSATICNWSSESVARRARTELARGEGPLFLFVNFMDAHDPYYCSRGTGYRVALQCVDEGVGAIVGAIRRPTLIVIASDHGEQFGEHGLVRHGNSLYTQLLHVPLIAHAPWMHAARDSAPRSLMELPRLIDAWLAHAPTPPPTRAIASVLVPPGGEPAQASIVDGDLHFILRSGNHAELYDLARDPSESTNLASQSAADVARIEPAASALLRRARGTATRQQEFRSLGYVH